MPHQTAALDGLSKLKSHSFEARDIEMSLVRLRNSIKFHLDDKGPADSTKYFCLGPARSGTTTMHNAFESVGLRSAHKAGNWPLGEYDAFSDRGDYRPYQKYASYYENAYFIVNTRPVGAWVKSRARYRNRPISTKSFANMIHRRNQFFIDVFNYFRTFDRFLIVNIQKEGAIADAFGSMGLSQPAKVEKANASPSEYPYDNYANVCRALEGAIDESEQSEPFLIPSLTPSDTLAQFSKDDPRVFL